MQFGERLDHRETYSRSSHALIIGLEESVEHLVQVVFRYSHAVVGHLQHHIATHTRSREHNVAPVRSVFQSI